jgi:hypothetical protein
MQSLLLGDKQRFVLLICLIDVLRFREEKPKELRHKSHRCHHGEKQFFSIIEGELEPKSASSEQLAVRGTVAVMTLPACHKATEVYANKRQRSEKQSFQLLFRDFY